MTNQDILFASLVGSKVVKLLPRFSALENEMGKHVLPAIPFLPFQNVQTTEKKSFDAFDNLWQADQPLAEEQQFFPLRLSIDNGNTYFLLPYEPMVTISGKNEIIKRNVAKWTPDYSKDFFGTVKERWAKGDYEIQITGFLMGSLLTGNVEDCFPKDDFMKLNDLLSNAKLKVLCEPLHLLGIDYLAVESFTFPFTKGENVQAYDIKCSSDAPYSLLITEEDA